MLLNAFRYRKRNFVHLLLFSDFEKKNVLEPIMFVDTPAVQSVRENEDASIKCMTTGDPEPTISWYFNGEALNCK